MKTEQFPRRAKRARRTNKVIDNTTPTQNITDYEFDHKHGASKKQLRRPLPCKFNKYELPKTEKLLDDDGKLLNKSPLYAYNDWEDSTSGMDITLLKKSDTVINIKDYREIDAVDSKNMIVFSSTTGKFVAGKITRDNAKQYFGGKKKYRKIRRTIEKLGNYVPNVKRGDQRSGLCTKYNLQGTRKNPKDNKCGQYAFKPNTPEGIKQEVKEEVIELVCGMEKGAERIFQVMPETKAFRYKQALLELNTVGKTETSIATQFSSGENYWSQAHTDDDAFFSTLSCMSKKKEDDEKVMYYFVFPEYELKIPMKPGDVMVFNPLELHSCSNCRIKDSYIFSAYVSKKTFITTGMEKGLDIK